MYLTYFLIKLECLKLLHYHCYNLPVILILNSQHVKRHMQTKTSSFIHILAKIAPLYLNDALFDNVFENDQLFVGIFEAPSGKVPTISDDNESLQNLPQDLASAQMKGNVGAIKAPILFDILQLSRQITYQYFHLQQ